MLSFIKKYYPELIVFAAIFGVLLICCTPDITWINTNCDGPHYIYSAKYLYPAHKTSAPLFLLLGHLFLYIPFGTEAFRMGLISVLSGIVGSIFIYLTAKEYTKENKYSRLVSIIAALIYGGSALALSQNIIVESYPLLVTSCVLSLYFATVKKWKLSALFIGVAGAIHPLVMFFAIPMLIKYKELRQWKTLGIMASFVLFYLYIPLTNRAPYMWDQPNSNGIFGFVRDTLSTGGMLSAGLSIWDFPKRVLDAIGLLGVSFAIIGIVPLVYAFWKTKVFKSILFWITLLPILYYITDLAPQTYVYMQPSIAFGAIIIAIGLAEMRREWIFATLGCAIIFLGINTNYFDIGRTLDTRMSALEFKTTELPKVPNNQILLCQQGWEWAIVYPYNKDNNRNIIPICVGTLASPVYQKDLLDEGIKFNIPDKSLKLSLISLQDNILHSIIDNNNNVWITATTYPDTYGAEILPVIGNEEKLIQTPTAIADGSMDMVWKWKPSNPYDIITGSIEVNDWKNIVISNYNIMTFSMLGVIGAVPVWILYMFIVKKKKWHINKAKEIIKKSVKEEL